MRTNALINFVLVTGATACLMGVVTKPAEPGTFQEDNYNYKPSKLTMPVDSPETEEEEKPDLHYKFKDHDGNKPLNDPKSKLYLTTPENIKTEVVYDPKTGQYNIKQKVGTFDYRPETYMNLKEYKDYMFRKQMREYWRTKVASDELNNQPRKGLIPKLQVNSELFDRIFGGNTVDIKPTGTAELIFGLTRSKNFNPAIPQKQQKITNFDFNMRIQLNLIGKIGEKLKVTTNYNTEASFDWENQVKMDYTGLEDEILKKIEAGNVSLPLNSTLISGSQTLFGFKTEMQFGKLRATTIFSQQKGKKTEISVQGGAQTQSFTIQADNYEQNKHYFLGHYFRERYDNWMATLPIVTTPIVINKVEVYVLSINGNAEQTRNVTAFEDLGEDIAYTSTTQIAGIVNNMTGPSGGLNLNVADNYLSDSIPRNDANNLYFNITDNEKGILKDRKVDDVTALLSSNVVATNPNNGSSSNYMDGSRDYNIIRNARRLNASEFSFNARLGYISLNQQLNNDQALAVAYQYQYNGKTYQVGEFSDQVPDNSKMLICKLLKSAVVNVKQPMWKLLMKNVYALGAYNLNAQDFKLDVYYNNIETGVDIPYLPFGSVNGQQLIRVLGCDRLSVNGDKLSDGVYDFVDKYTISVTNGRAYFPKVEPFGRGLQAKFTGAEDFPKANEYIFTELYDSTRITASNIQSKNRFKIKGSYRAASGSEIALNALNIPQGAVVVTANGVALVENVDYTVDYTLGRVKIINESILNSGSNIKVSLESNSLFSVQQKNLWGTRLDYKAGRNLSIGSTLLRFTERPITQKVSIGDEPVSNFIAGLDFNYKTDAPFLTRWLDKLPFYSTKEMSTITMRGEGARLFPGNAKAIKKNGGNSYIDDFEGSVSLIDIKGAGAWYLASVPQGLNSSFPEATKSNDIAAGINRARFSWYNVDAMFTRDQSGTTPKHFVDKKLFTNNMWRQVFETELFPGKTPPNGQQVVLPILDLAFFPSERGPYNYDVKKTSFSSGINKDGSLANPQSRWGGIMRKLETNDFQAANVEYIQFWLMDPYNEDYKQETDEAFDKNDLPKGDLYINLGNISEDIVRDGGMVYENGIPGKSSYSSENKVASTKLADVPVQPPIVNAFSQDNNDRPLQDVGYDGLSDENERLRFKDALSDISDGTLFDQSAPAITNFKEDPSTDRYHFFRGDDYDKAQYGTIKRYSRFNNPEGNSPTQEQYANLNPEGGNYPTGSTTLPNIEDINRDNTLSDIENYYQYRVRISPTEVNPSAVGSNFIVDAFTGTAEFSGVTKSVKWYQFKIPISQFESNVGGIEGFNSIRFMRVYMKGFNKPVLLRMARFELVRSDWRRYQYDLRKPGEYLAFDHNNTSFDVSAVSLQENSTKSPVNYVMPPDIQQQQNVQTTNLVLQNEQALQMRICDLKDGDSRAIFKNVDLDTRMFNNIKMNVHGEQLNNIPLKDGDLTLFFRVGTDYNNNFYEYEVPLKLTPKGSYDPNSIDARYTVWPVENEINFKFSDISNVKQERNNEFGYYSNLNQLSKPYSKDMGGYTVTIVGNPNLGTIKSVMVGVRNPKNNELNSHCVEVWVNELRLTDFNNKGGWATTGQIQAKLADLGTLSLAGTYKSPYWGSVESKINERSRETNYNWDVSTQINAGKFLPSKLKISLPVFYSYGVTRIIPLFNPLDPDVKMEDLKKMNKPALEDSIRRQTEDFTERKSFNLSNVRIDGLKRAKAKPMPWDISNFNATYAYSETSKRSVNVEYNVNRMYRANLQYAFSIRNPLVLKPFAKMKIFDKKVFGLIKDFNLQIMPNSFGASVDVNRTYAAVKNRDITSFYTSDTLNKFINRALINKNFTINRSYNFMWSLSKSVKVDYTATNEGRILEPSGEVWKSDKVRRDSLVKRFFGTAKKDSLGRSLKGTYGENTTFRQQMNLTMDVPLNKIRILDFAKVSYRYGGTYTWSRRPFAAEESVGNTIQNTNAQNITASFNMTQLYNKIPFLKNINNPVPKQAVSSMQEGAGKNKSGKGELKASATNSNTPEKKSNFKEITELLAKTLMMVKNISMTAQINKGQALSSFRPNSQIMGLDFESKKYLYAPGLRFATGQFDPRIRERSIDNGWLTQNNTQTTPYTAITGTNISYKASVEPHSSLKIELNGTYNKQFNRSEYIIYDPTNTTDRLYKDYNINSSPNITGNFNMTTFTLLRSFKDGKDPVRSKIFDEFLADRFNVARQLATANSKANGGFSDGEISATPSTSTSAGNPGYVDGYSVNQQDVIIHSFYRNYTGRSIKGYNTQNIFPTIPLPNWSVTWDGLGKIKALKKHFRGIILRHNYRSTYSINAFSNNLLFNADGKSQDKRVPVSTGTTSTNNFVSLYNVGAVTISEQFSPLIKIEFQFVKTGWSANFETKRDKTTSLNITGLQIIETKGQEYITGLANLIPKLKLKKIKIQGKVLESNLNLRLDFSYRKNISVIRRLDDGSSTPTGGTNIITMRSSADYALTSNVTLRIFYDWIRTRPQTSAAFPTSNVNAGFSLRINFQ
ncbi:MAG: cell surface protein SprA [Bacteroidia bacterium]|nr:cell surface protein SprA [Bacteroidia bacterium]